MSDAILHDGWREPSGTSSGLGGSFWTQNYTPVPSDDLATNFGSSSLPNGSDETNTRKAKTPSPPQRKAPSQDHLACDDCKKVHDPCRLVICVDGTSMGPDGQVGNYTGNTTNIFRIWSLVPQQQTVHDASGRRWNQKCHDFLNGPGTTPSLIKRTFTVVTGKGRTGCDGIIKNVYRACCGLCPSRDEIFMFGFSRGAFIVRAVAGMLHHLGALRLNTNDFDKTLIEALACYRSVRDNDEEKQHSRFRYYKQFAQEACKIRFLGTFDTVKVFNDADLNDIGVSSNVYHVRHALALFERRSHFPLERFELPKLDESDSKVRSFQEAWFAGSHGDIGGACEDDGLALWPLQWILSEAQRFGLVLNFRDEKSCGIVDPQKLIFPGGNSEQKTIRCVNGICVRMHDLSEIHKRAGFNPRVSKSLWNTERHIFEDKGLIGQMSSAPLGTFVHPSVFLMDQKYALMIDAINSFSYAQRLRDEEKNIRKEDRDMWRHNKKLQISQELRKNTRILVCGQTGVGKSKLINVVLDKNVTSEVHGTSVGHHDINTPFTVPGKPYVLHDSNGFESGNAENFEKVQRFIDSRRQAHLFREQLHCIWFCSTSVQPRIQPSDRQFLKLKFGEVPVILVFTKSDILRDTIKNDVLEQYIQSNPGVPEVNEVAALGEPDQSKVKTELDRQLQAKQRTQEQEWMKYAPKETSALFVSSRISDKGSINKLKDESKRAMTGPRMKQIHADAEEAHIKKKIKDSIEKIGKSYDANAPWINPTRGQAHVGNFRSKILQEISGVFGYRGYDPDSMPLTVQSLVHPSESRASSWKPLSDVADYTPLGIGSLLLRGPYSAAAGSAITSVWSIAMARKTSYHMIRECVDALLIMDRIYYYDGEVINNEYVKEACLDYLKRRKEIDNGMDSPLLRLCVRYNGEIVKKFLEEIIEKLRYRNTSTE